MEVWLKETILGIIILGSIGSALAALSLYLLKKGFKFIAPKAYDATNNLIVNLIYYMIQPSIHAQAKLLINKDPSKTNAYFSMLKAQYIMYMFIATWLMLWLAIRIKIDQVSFGSIESIAYIAIIIFTLGLALRKYSCLVAPWLFDFDEIVQNILHDRIKRSANKSSNLTGEKDSPSS